MPRTVSPAREHVDGVGDAAAVIDLQIIERQLSFGIRPHVHVDGDGGNAGKDAVVCMRELIKPIANAVRIDTGPFLKITPARVFSSIAAIEFAALADQPPRRELDHAIERENRPQLAAQKHLRLSLFIGQQRHQISPDSYVDLATGQSRGSVLGGIDGRGRAHSAA